MAFLTLGGNLYEVQHTGAEQNPSDFAGEAARSFDQTYRSGRRDEKRVWSFTLIPMSQADEATFRALIGIDTQLTANGDFSGNVAVSVIVNVTGSTFLPSGTGFVRVITIQMLEV